MSRLRTTAILLVGLTASVVQAQEPPPTVDNMVGIAVVFPPGTRDVQLIAQLANDQDSITFVDDGSSILDRHGDGEWWAMVQPTRGSTPLVVSGTAEGVRVFHEDQISIPSAWMSMIYPVTFLAILDGDHWRLVRTLTAAMPKLDDNPTGSGIGGKAQSLGFSPTAVYLLWGGLVLALALTAILRSAVLQARRAGGTRA